MRIELGRRNGKVTLAIADDGEGFDGDGSDTSGTGLSIVRALVRDELRGTIELRTSAGSAPRSSSP